jgi:hypothetical protein
VSTGVAIRHWRSAADSSACGLELLEAQHSPETLAATLDAAHASVHARNAAFLLVCMAPTDRAGAEMTLEIAAAFSSSTRVYLSIDRSTLSRIGSKRLDTRRVGLLLNDVDCDTPPSDIVHEAIEAIRFRADFIRQARGELRLRCALDSTLFLAHNLGIATLGPTESALEELHVSGIQFDWTSAALSENDEIRSSHARRA